jgi:hypothetical protein
MLPNQAKQGFDTGTYTFETDEGCLKLTIKKSVMVGLCIY